MSTASMEGSSFRTLIPATVIIDTRNLVGQAEEVLGKRRNPDVAGVRLALEWYGFAVQKVIVATGTRSQGSVAPESRLAKAIRDNCDYADRVRAAGGIVLEGYLRDRYGKPEEKQVDVLCARAIAEEAYAVRHGESSARAIVLLSKDSDLTPMFDFAHGLDVPVYAAAPSVVHNRELDYWLLLGQAAIATMTAARGLIGHGVRDTVAQFAFHGWDRCHEWTVTGTAKRNGRDVIKLRHPSGAQGSALPQEFGGRRPVRESRHPLYPVGVDLGERSIEFPMVALGRTAGAQCERSLVRAVLIERIGPTKAEVRLDFGPRCVIDVPVDNMTIGRAVLVQADDRRARFVGGLQEGGPTRADAGVLVPQVAEVTGGIPGSGVVKGLLTDGSPVVIRLPRSQRAGIGSRFVTVAAGATAEGLPLFQAISSRLGT
ncbi:hypothetical protein AB0L53_35380 [Nonomuraea sp. NPDC052129]|uniref:hypothetical protein n=1 Tax=Nonomuraea sp. NPDC052129 TaxID=3154651 RepID=UPI0034492A44